MPGKKTSRSGEAPPERSWELKDIQQLIDLLTEREVAEFEMEKDGMRIRILRQAATLSRSLRTIRVAIPYGSLLSRLPARRRLRPGSPRCQSRSLSRLPKKCMF